MSFKDTFTAIKQKFKLDSHHTMERSGIFFGTIALTGAVVLTASGFAASVSGQDEFESKAVWSTDFTTSKTELSGEVDGVYTNSEDTRALVLMHFEDSAQISYDANDYRAFLLGSNESMGVESVATPGVTGQFVVFGSTGYVGVLLESERPFAQQVLNLTMRSNAELAATAPDAEVSELAEGDDTFRTHDQWRLFVNPGATGAKEIEALDSTSFDPAQAFYETVSKAEEADAKTKLDQQLVTMRTNLRQIDAYTQDMATTKVDGLFLRPPQVPSFIAGDTITGQSATEAEDGKSTLTLTTGSVAPGGFDINWRAGNVYDGYLTALVPKGQSYVSYLAEKADESEQADEETGETSVEVSDLDWILSDGSDLANDHSGNDTTMRPLTTVMNNLSQAYQDYSTSKSKYQSDLTFELLRLDVDLRDVQSNSSTRSDEDFLITYYE